MSMQQEQPGKYQLLERLGRGGMGEVWKARDTQLQRYVAIKLLNADLQADPDFITHFMREAQLVASLRHPNIVQVHDFQSASTLAPGMSALASGVKAYMVMDYVEGGTLADFIQDTSRQGRFPSPVDIVYLLTAISLALDYAHGTGMVHRDIKPANILLDRSIPGSKAMGEPILTDFGIARLQGSGDATATRSLVGTPLYISPEQAESHPIDARSDLYSLGIVLYEMLTGITPFRGDNPFVVMMLHVQEQPLSPALINPNISPALAAVVLRSIAKEPQARFPSAAAMTIAVAQACNVQVPARLRGPAEEKTGLTYNPLQPLSGSNPFASSSVTLQSTASTPVSRPGMMTPVYTPPFGNMQVSQTPVLSSQQEVRLQQPLPAPRRPARPGRRRRWLLLTCIACALLLLAGVSAAVVPGLLAARTATSTPVSTNAVVGQISFARSSNASQGSFDQLQIDLTNIPSAPAGTNYYAWLAQDNSEAVIIPHWQLHIVQGAIHSAFSYQQYSDLFSTSHLFLITTEDTTAPDIPNLDLSRRLYYAAIVHTSSATHLFDVKKCPASNGNNAANPCS